MCFVFNVIINTSAFNDIVSTYGANIEKDIIINKLNFFRQFLNAFTRNRGGILVHVAL
ncbi:hypothetical protein GMES_0463 [Paraglaciecola mesophila KMM 241]|uniref:Uncharacterized protein n=1 Tax=Paraglaciecola mesophila KMM 241 TaxID=1128912 RepID=K6XQ48_9ALTE|nr:hypothetical protein GMES_0463 [Paraglaciecola mesophila KMM 241]